MSLSTIVKWVCSGSAKLVLLKCAVSVFVLYFGTRLAIRLLRRIVYWVYRALSVLVALSLIVVALLLAGKYVVEGKMQFLQEQHHITQLVEKLLPSDFQVVSYYEGDIDRDSVPEYLIVYRYDLPPGTKGANAESEHPLGAVVIDAQKNISPELMKKGVPSSTGTYLTYQLLPRVSPGERISGGVGRSDAKPVLYSTKNSSELAIFGYDDHPWVTTFSIYRWSEDKYQVVGRWEGDEGISVYSKGGKPLVPQSGGHSIPEVKDTPAKIVVHRRLPGRSYLCKESTFVRDGPGKKFVENGPSVALCHAKLQSNYHPLYPEETVVAFYQALAQGNTKLAESYLFSAGAIAIPSGKPLCQPYLLESLDSELKPYKVKHQKGKVRLVQVEYSDVVKCARIPTLSPSKELEAPEILGESAKLTAPPTPEACTPSPSELISFETSVRVHVVLDDSLRYVATWLVKQFPENSNNPSKGNKWVLCNVDLERVEKVPYPSAGSQR
jgi:hypothetical protein